MKVKDWLRISASVLAIFLVVALYAGCTPVSSVQTTGDATGQQTQSVGGQILSGIGTVVEKANWFLSNEAPIMAGICSGSPTGDLKTACSVYSLAQAGTAIGAANIQQLQTQTLDPTVQAQIQKETASLAQNIEVLNQAAKVDSVVSAQKVITAAPPPVKVVPIAPSLAPVTGTSSLPDTTIAPVAPAK
jgi:hypothetical protein